jgi:hypothetical protein
MDEGVIIYFSNSPLIGMEESVKQFSEEIQLQSVVYLSLMSDSLKTSSSGA